MMIAHRFYIRNRDLYHPDIRCIVFAGDPPDLIHCLKCNGICYKTYTGPFLCQGFDDPVEFAARATDEYTVRAVKIRKSICGISLYDLYVM